MAEIVIVSGKGGTGKTTVTAAFAELAGNAVVCDLDVDTPDLHLILDPEIENSVDFYAGHRAEIDPDLCQGCGVCADLCRFDAIVEQGTTYAIDPMACEGCKVCVTFCSAGAIAFPRQHRGRTHHSRTRFGPLIHADLFPGEENSGLLVSQLKAEARDLARRERRDVILCDGSPGIGCPVIASLSGADMAVIVTEPSPAGYHDLLRIADLAEHFRVRAAVVVNKADLNPALCKQVFTTCHERKLPVIAALPFDLAAVDAMMATETVIECGAQGLAQRLRAAWSTIERIVGIPAAGVEVI